MLALVAVAAAPVVVLHAAPRYRRPRDLPGRRPSMTVTDGKVALATIGIARQLRSIALVSARS